MPSMTTKARNCAIRSQFGADKGAVALSTLYFALFSGDPTGAGVEPTSTGAYARVAKTNDATLWSTISSSDVSVNNHGTSGAIVWPALTALWSQTTLSWWAIFDNSTGGNLWYYGPLTTPIVPTGSGDVPRIASGALVLTQAA